MCEIVPGCGAEDGNDKGLLPKAPGCDAPPRPAPDEVPPENELDPEGDEAGLPLCDAGLAECEGGLELGELLPPLECPPPELVWLVPELEWLPPLELEWLLPELELE